jgi:cytochrome c
MRSGSMLVIMATATAAWLPGEAAAQDGQAVFRRQCAACHATEAGQNKIGPTVHGVAGNKAASVPGFAYSDALKNANLTWTDDTLEKYLADPKGAVPGGKMVFAGLKNPAEAKAVVDYLKTLK